MMLYLVRHGDAVGADVNPERPLSREGRKDILKVAQYLKKNNIEIDCIWHSGKKRAIETAQLIAEALDRKELCEEHVGLNPNDDVEIMAEEINEVARIEDEREGLMVVGHLPLLEQLGSFLITGSASGQIIEFHAGGVACLHRDGQGKWSFAWGVYPEMINLT